MLILTRTKEGARDKKAPRIREAFGSGGLESAFPLRLHEADEKEKADHGKGDGHLGGDTQGQAEGRADPRPSGGAQIAADGELADDGADEGAEQNAGDAEKETDHGAQGRPDRRPLRGAEVPRAKGAGEKVGEHAEDGEAAEDGERPPADIGEIFAPGGDQQAGENDRHSGKGRQEQAGEADEGQDGGEEQKERCRIHGDYGSGICRLWEGAGKGSLYLCIRVTCSLIVI